MNLKEKARECAGKCRNELDLDFSVMALCGHHAYRPGISFLEVLQPCILAALRELEAEKDVKLAEISTKIHNLKDRIAELEGALRKIKKVKTFKEGEEFLCSACREVAEIVRAAAKGMEGEDEPK